MELKRKCEDIFKPAEPEQVAARRNDAEAQFLEKLNKKSDIEIIDELLDRDMDTMENEDFKWLLREGFKGYKNMSRQKLLDIWQEYYGGWDEQIDEDIFKPADEDDIKNRFSSPEVQAMENDILKRAEGIDNENDLEFEFDMEELQVIERLYKAGRISKQWMAAVGYPMREDIFKAAKPGDLDKRMAMRKKQLDALMQKATCKCGALIKDSLLELWDSHSVSYQRWVWENGKWIEDGDVDTEDSGGGDGGEYQCTECGDPIDLDDMDLPSPSDR